MNLIRDHPGAVSLVISPLNVPENGQEKTLVSTIQRLREYKISVGLLLGFIGPSHPCEVGEESLAAACMWEKGQGRREEAKSGARRKVKFLPIVLALLREGSQLLTGLDFIDGHVLVRTILSLDYEGNNKLWKAVRSICPCCPKKNSLRSQTFEGVMFLSTDP